MKESLVGGAKCAGTVVSLRDKRGLHTGWSVLDENGQQLGYSHGRGLRGDAEQAVLSCLPEGSKVKLGELMGLHTGYAAMWFPWEATEKKSDKAP